MVSTHYDTQVDETISSISATHGSPKKAQERRGMSSYVMLCWKSVKLATFCNRRNGRKDLGVWSGMLTRENVFEAGRVWTEVSSV